MELFPWEFEALTMLAQFPSFLFCRPLSSDFARKFAKQFTCGQLEFAPLKAIASVGFLTGSNKLREAVPGFVRSPFLLMSPRRYKVYYLASASDF